MFSCAPPTIRRVMMWTIFMAGAALCNTGFQAMRDAHGRAAQNDVTLCAFRVSKPFMGQSPPDWSIGRVVLRPST